MQLIKLLPDYYESNATMILLQGILSEVTELLDNDLSAMILDCFVSTASSLLSRYEEIYGLSVDASQSDVLRKERIAAKLTGAGTSTKEMIRQTAASYAYGKIEILEDNENYIFRIRFADERGIPKNMDNLKLTIEEIKPAHLAVEYVYTYNTWADIQNAKMMWSEASGYTWEGIRTVNV